MKPFISLALASVLAVGCAGVRVSPEARNVRSVAIVALAANEPIRENQAPEGVRDNLFLNKAHEARRGVLEKARTSVYTHLSRVPGWEVTPFDALSDNPAYRAALADSRWVPTISSEAPGLTGAPGMLAVSTDRLSANAVLRFEDAHVGRYRDALAKLAADLGVDAVAVVYFDLSYDPALADAEGVLTGRPNVAATLALVTRDGNLPLTAKQNTRYLVDPPVPLALRGKAVESLESGSPTDPAKSAKAFALALEYSAAALAEEVGKGLARHTL